MPREYQIAEAKRSLRREMKARRDAAAGSEQSAADSAAIAAKVIDLPEWNNARTILLYSSLPGEVSTATLLGQRDALLEQSKRLVLPLVEGDHLLLKVYENGHLTAGYKGIMEPSQDAQDVPASEIDLAIIPGVAFDPHCRRLGRGKGYYDRTLPQLNCPKIGLAFSWQIVDEVPCDEWDQPLDAVVTPDAVFREKH